jgi:hypothetical protein
MYQRVVIATLLLLISACGRGTDAGKAFTPAQGHPDLWASHLTVGSDDFHGTFIKSVPPASSGAELFVLHCAPCHGNDAAGKIGTNIQTATLLIVNAAIRNIPIMRGHAGLSQDQVQDILAYVATLAANAQPLAGTFDAALCTQCHGAGLQGGIARVSCFSCHNGPDGSIGHPAGWVSGKDNPATFHGRYGRDLVAGCTTCHGVTFNGSIVLLGPSGFAPACSTCHNGTIAPVL